MSLLEKIIGLSDHIFAMFVINPSTATSIPSLYLCSSQIHSLLLGDKVDYGIGLSYRPASLCSLTGRAFVIVNFRDYELGLSRPG
jgi:hypothetical protein